MKIGLLENFNGKLFPNYSEKFRALLQINEIPFVLIDPNSESLLEEIQSCTHLLFRHSQGDTDLLLYDAIYNIACNVFNVKCSPGYETYWSYENKIKEYYLLKAYDFPVVETRVFWNYCHAELYLRNAEFPLVVKLPKGAGSSNVVIINSFDEGRKIIRQVYLGGVSAKKLPNKSNLVSFKKLGLKKYIKTILKSQLMSAGLMKNDIEYPEWQIQKDTILFQKYLPGNTFDTRVTTIGNRAFAFRRFVRENDFRASGSGLIDWDKSKIDINLIKIAFTISKKLNFETMTYDFIYDLNMNPFICEISYCFVDWAVERCPGYWDPGLGWNEGHNWPQYYQLEDFLAVSGLKSI